MKKYQIIYADPPWSYKVYSKKGLGRSAESHYPTMRIEDICALPVGDLADKDCALFLWVTIPCLLEGLSVLRAWGFTYKTIGFVWVKQNKKSDSLFWGMGYWTRSNVELCILATKGHPKRVNAADAFCLALHGADLHIRSGAWAVQHGDCSAWRGCAYYLFHAERCDSAGHGIFD